MPVVLPSITSRGQTVIEEVVGCMFGVFVALCVQSFIQARRRRQSVNASEAEA